jgi:L-amino acid N-acyltransferase YncA
MNLAARPATPDDAERIAQIYNEGIEDRLGTFETRLRSTNDVRTWFDGVHPIVVVESETAGEAHAGTAEGRGRGAAARLIVAFASTSTYRARECYAGIAEFSVYVARGARGMGAGRIAMQALIDAVAHAGIWKLVSRVFIENAASRKLLASVGFREVGIYEKHAQLDGRWRDVVIVERPIPENIRQ